MATYAELDIIHAMANKVSFEITDKRLLFPNDIDILNTLNELKNRLSEINTVVSKKLTMVNFEETMYELKNIQDQALAIE